MKHRSMTRVWLGVVACFATLLFGRVAAEQATNCEFHIVGLDRLFWGMDEAEIRSMYPHAVDRPSVVVGGVLTNGGASEWTRLQMSERSVGDCRFLVSFYGREGRLSDINLIYQSGPLDKCKKRVEMSLDKYVGLRSRGNIGDGNIISPTSWQNQAVVVLLTEVGVGDAPSFELTLSSKKYSSFIRRE